jgi:hypothetical protein
MRARSAACSGVMLRAQRRQVVSMSSSTRRRRLSDRAPAEPPSVEASRP